MNIFIIPSWYPSKESPIGGIFIKEQAEALADLYPEINFTISYAENFFLSVSQIKSTMGQYKKYKEADASEKIVKHNLVEIRSPVITWTGKLGGDINNIIKAHSKNFQRSGEIFGKADLMHAHVSFPGGYSAMMLSRKFNVPYIITEHMAPFPFEVYQRGGKLSKKISEPLKNASQIISVSNFSASEIESFGIKKPVVIPNLVNETAFSPEAPGKGKDEVNFLTVTTFIERKGIDELLESMRQVFKKDVRCSFTIAGVGPMKDEIENFITNNNFSEKVNLINEPTREEIVTLMKRCDVFVLPSRHESFGIVYVEAMACGKPVIATDCGGTSDFVNPITGVMVKKENVKELSEAIIFMIDNYKNYDGASIRNYFMKNFSREAVCSKIVSEYNTLIYRRV